VADDDRLFPPHVIGAQMFFMNVRADDYPRRFVAQGRECGLYLFGLVRLAGVNQQNTILSD